MIRRWFRLGLTLGVLCGAALALAKVLSGRSDRSAPATAPVPAQPWPRLQADPGATPPATASSPAPAAPAGGAPATQATAGAGTTTAPQASRVRPADEVVRPTPGAAGDAPAPGSTSAGPARTSRPAKKAPLKAGPAPARKAPAKRAAAAGKATKAAAKAKGASSTAWVAPDGDVCPTSHPVKAKLASKIFHVPGMLNYLRTRPDRCYVDAAAAEADGLRPAKR